MAKPSAIIQEIEAMFGQFLPRRFGEIRTHAAINLLVLQCKLLIISHYDRHLLCLIIDLEGLY